MGFLSRLLKHVVKEPLAKLALAVAGDVLAEYGSKQAEQIISRLPRGFVCTDVAPGHRVIGVDVGPEGEVNLESFLRRTGELAEAELKAIEWAAKHG